MPYQQLVVYLNDHLAGSNSALEILATLQEMNGLGDWANHLSDEIGADRKELENLMSDLQIAQGTFRQAAGRLTGWLAELKTRLEDRQGGGLQRLELLEALALGIDGKRALWTALQSASQNDMSLRERDYSRLIERAIEQREDVEIRRRAAAAEALGRSQLEP
jgi:hypothetical protein